MTNSNWVFDKAVDLMDERSESTGETVTQDTKGYRDRTLGILNVLRHQLYRYSTTYIHGRSCPEIQNFEQFLDLDDDLAQTVLPYGLAAHLQLGENDSMASFFQQRYEELLFTLGRNRAGAWEDIVSPYG